MLERKPESFSEMESKRSERVNSRERVELLGNRGNSKDKGKRELTHLKRLGINHPNQLNNLALGERVPGRPVNLVRDREEASLVGLKQDFPTWS